MFATAMLTNAASVYLLHDVDTDRMGKWNLAYGELTSELLLFGLIVAAIFLLLTWMGTVAFGLRDARANMKLGLALGIAVILIQYPAEFAVRKLSSGDSAEMFLLGYLLLSPICCAAIILLDSHKRRRTDAQST
jgi:hypothetical protein